MTVGASPAAAASPVVAPVPLTSILPAPVSANAAPGVTFAVTAGTEVYTAPGSPGAATIGELLAGLLRRSTGYRLPILDSPDPLPAGGIALLLTGAPAAVGAEGYQLDITGAGITLRANAPAGLFAGVQTLRQLLPAAAESATVQPGPWLVAGGRVVDHPRFAYRGVMLDVARHFFPMPAVKRFIDEVALYKINHLHLHLTDDQGWRVAIDSWPDLATYGGGTAVGPAPGGFFTRAEYAELVAYAAARYVTMVPEIDMPGHTNAALAAYPELNADGIAPDRYTGTAVGFSSLCVGKELTYTFVDQVLGEVATLTPGPYLHIGGDEADSTTPADYTTFVNRVQRIVAGHGKTTVGWHDIVNADPLPSTVAQFWGTTSPGANGGNRTGHDAVAAAARRGTRLILSPSDRSYLDMKYDPGTTLGQQWAGFIEVRDAYGWDPGGYLPGVDPAMVLGVEAPLWTETIRTLAEVEQMAFPRLAALAELGWSPAARHDWTAFRERLGAQGLRWRTMGVEYHRTPQISWPAGS